MGHAKETQPQFAQVGEDEQSLLYPLLRRSDQLESSDAFGEPYRLLTRFSPLRKLRLRIIPKPHKSERENSRFD